MPYLDDYEIVEGADEASSDDLRIAESVEIGEGAVQSDGSVVLNLIRPCVGRGRGRHLYTADMLKENAHKFTGWKMYVNHLSEAARRALGGLPRDVRDLGGIVVESYWNPDVEAEGRFGKGAVQGIVKPVPVVQELLRVDPRLVEASINATATSCKRGKVGKEDVWIVEGIEERGSVDWVTEAGAGGRVAQIMEAMIEDGSALSDTLDTLDNGTIMAWLTEHRPELAEALKKGAAAGSSDGNGSATAGASTTDDDLNAEIEKLMKRPGMKRSQAEALAKQALKKKGKSDVTESAEEDRLPDLTPEEVLTEALASEDGRDALASALSAVLPDAIKGLKLGDAVLEVVEAKLDEEREVIRAEAEARADRRNTLRDMRDTAQNIIAECRLPDVAKKRLAGEYALVEGKPTSKLDLVDDEDANGAVVKSAMDKLRESVEADIKEMREFVGAVNPTRVRDQGPTRTSLHESRDAEPEKDGKKGDENEVRESASSLGPATRRLLESAGVKNPEKAFERSLDRPRHLVGA